MAGRRSATAEARAHEAASGGGRAGRPEGRASRVVPVRLQAEEVAALQEVMRQLYLFSISEALREGIRLLVREAAEVAAPGGIRDFYGEQPAPLPDGVIPPTEHELAAER